MPTPLRVLILEDNPADAELIVHELRKSEIAPSWQRVEDECSYVAALDPALDVVLADYTLPQFDALRALHLLRDRGLDVPFVVVTASISEEVAVECMKQGAADYLLKDRLIRLGPSIHAAIDARRLREEKQAAEAALRELDREKAAHAAAEDAQRRFKRIVESNIIGIIVCDEDRIVEANDVFLEMVGCSREDLQAGRLSWRAMTPPEYLAAGERQIQELRERGVYGAYEKEYIGKDGDPVPILLGGAALDESPLTWISFVVDLSEQKKVERERELLLAREQAARVEAQEAVQQRDQLLAVVSHDLKNPLTRIKGYAQLAQRQFSRHGSSDQNALLQGLRTIEQTVTTMTRQLNELVDGARLQIGEKLVLDRQPTDLVPLVQQIVASTQLSTDRHRVLVEASVRELIGNWDPVRLERVLGNLLDNAVKFSPEGGEITVTVATLAETPGGWAMVTVSDHGIGIPESEREQVFERFHRGSNAVGRAAGNGLGLSGARQIIAEHGGSIAVESEEGRGSTFTVRLPLEGVSQATQAG